MALLRLPAPPRPATIHSPTALPVAARPGPRSSSPARWAALPISVRDRVMFLGKTGSGKTTLARSLLRRAGDYPWVVLDPKRRFQLRERGVRTSDHFNARDRHQIIRVPFDNEAERWEEVIWGVFDRGESILYVDELTLVTPRTYLRPALGAAIRAGREIGVGVWSASQRPKDIPSAAFTECEHIVSFQLTWEDDRKKVASFTNSELARPLARLSGHDFIYYNIDRDKAVRFVNVRR